MAAPASARNSRSAPSTITARISRPGRATVEASKHLQVRHDLRGPFYGRLVNPPMSANGHALMHAAGKDPDGLVAPRELCPRHGSGRSRPADHPNPHRLIFHLLCHLPH